MFNQVLCIVWNLVYEVSLVSGTGLFEAVPPDWKLLSGNVRLFSEEHPCTQLK